MEIIKASGGRKFIFVILVTVLSFVFVILGFITALQWTHFVTAIGAIYVVGNVGTKIAEKV